MEENVQRGERDSASGRLEDFLRRPPSVLVLVGLGWLSLLTLWIASLPPQPHAVDLRLPVLAAWLIAALWFVLRLTAYWFLLTRTGVRAVMRSALRWWSSPAVLALTLVVLDLRIPTRVRFELNRTEFEAAAQKALSSPHAADWRSNERLSIGAFPIDAQEALPEGVRFRFDPGDDSFSWQDFYGTSGFAFAPRGEPRDEGGVTYAHLLGDWYAFSD